MEVLCVILVLVCGWLGVWTWSQQRSLRQAAKQLAQRGEDGSAVRVRLAAPNAGAEELLAQVNHILELRQADRSASQERERELRRQISNISHDLRTPLTSILGYLQLLEDPELPPEQRAEYLAVVRGRAKALQSLITSFYDLSRLEGDEFPLERQNVDLRALLAELLASFYGDFTDAGFDVAVELPERLSPVWADPGGCLRVFTNLLRNALDHGGGTLAVRAWEEGDAVCTAVSNAAPDLSPEDVEHVFERFFTSNKNRTGRNTGLGLAIVKALGERMDARVEAALEDGCFTVTLTWRRGRENGEKRAVNTC